MAARMVLEAALLKHLQKHDRAQGIQFMQHILRCSSEAIRKVKGDLQDTRLQHSSRAYVIY
jgi:hypothetical protein